MIRKYRFCKILVSCVSLLPLLVSFNNIGYADDFDNCISRSNWQSIGKCNVPKEPVETREQKIVETCDCSDVCGKPGLKQWTDTHSSAGCFCACVPWRPSLSDLF